MYFSVLTIFISTNRDFYSVLWMRGQFGHRNPQINHFLCCYCCLHKERYCYIVNYRYFVLCSLISVLPAGRHTNFINILYPLISTSLVPFQLVSFCYRMFLNIYVCRVYYLSHDCNIVSGHYHITNITRKHYAWISYHHVPWQLSSVLHKPCHMPLY